MRSRAVVAVLATLLLVPASAFTFSRSLYFGDAGMAVANLQQFLNNDGDGNIAVTSYAPPCSTSRPRKASPQPAARGHSRGRDINTIEAQRPEWVTTLSIANGRTNVSGAQVHSPRTRNSVLAGAVGLRSSASTSGTRSHHGGVEQSLQ